MIEWLVKGVMTGPVYWLVKEGGRGGGGDWLVKLKGWENGVTDPSPG